MGTLIRRVPGTASWHVYKDGAKVGDVTQTQDGGWVAMGDGIGFSPIQAGTRKDAARQLTGTL